MKIFILGSNGFIGSSLTSHLKSSHLKNYFQKIIEVTNLEDIFNQDLSYMTHSIIVDCIGVKKFFYKTQSNSTSNQLLYKKVVSRYKRLLSFSSNTGSKFFFICSGGSIYGQYKGRPWSENDELNPSDEYGKVSELVEKMVINSNGISIRGSNIYGALKPNKQNQGIVTVSLLSYLSHLKINIYNNGKNVRDFLYIDDFNRAVTNLIFNNSTIPHIINVSSGIGLNQLEIIDIIDKILIANNKKSIKYYTEILESNFHDLDRNILSPELYKSIFGKLSYVDIEQGISIMMRKLEIF